MRLREYLETQKTNLKNNLKEATTRPVRPPEGDDDAWENFFDDMSDWLDSSDNISEYLSEFTRKDLFHLCYTGESPDYFPMGLDGDIAWMAGYALIDTYHKSVPFCDIFKPEFYKKMEQLGYTSTSELTVSEFIDKLFDQYLVNDQMINSKTGGYIFKVADESVYFYCTIEDENGKSIKGAVVMDMRDEATLVLMPLADFKYVLIDDMTDKLESSDEKLSLSKLVQTCKDCFNNEYYERGARNYGNDNFSEDEWFL